MLVLSQFLCLFIIIIIFLRYIQVGNAVAVPVARALGYGLGLACQAFSSLNEPLFRLPPKFPNNLERFSSAASEDDA